MPSRTRLRRTVTAAVVAAASGLGFIAAAGPAAAAGPWFVNPLGLNSNTCLSAAAPCQTIAGAIAKAGFVDGDTINLSTGTFAGNQLIQAKTANIVGPTTGTATINGAATSYAIGVNIGNGKTLTLSNVTLTNGKSANGGALTISTGQVVANNVVIQNSTGTGTSGGAFVNTGTSLTMNGGAVNGNTGPVGGGVYSTGTLTTNGTSFTSNTSSFGGGVAAAGTINLTNSTFTSNTASNQGGAIFNNTGVLTLSGTSLLANTSVAGGGIYQQAGTTNVTNGSSITSNKATTSHGGGIFQAAGTTSVTTSSQVSSNNAGNQGGGIYSAAGTVTTNGANVNGNSAAILGGGVTVVSGTANLTGGSLTGNTSLNGGALYNGGTTTVDGTTLSSNTANGGTTANGGNGGAVYNAAALTVKNATFNGNKVVLSTAAAPGVTGYGGAIVSTSLAASATPTLAFTNTTINGDNAGTPVSGGNANAGGAIAALGNIGAGGAATAITANGLTLSKNVAAAGGGIFSTGPVTLTNSTVSQNKATHPSAGIGGGLYTTPQASTTPTVTLDNTDVVGNDGAAGGGGIVTTTSTVIKNGSTVNGNSGAIGGGIYAGAPVSVTGSQVNDNDASNSGGGIYTLTPVTLTDSHVDGNSAAFLGGGLSTSTTGGFTMTGGTLSGNDAFAAGGLFLGNGLTSSLDDTDLVGNTSTGANFGGGAVLSAGQLTINKAQITGNKADGSSGQGGAIFSGSNDENITTSLKITNSTLSDNEAFSGAAISAGSDKASSTNKTSIANSTIHGNAASGPFGALLLSDPASIAASTITDNTAVPTNPFDAYGGIVAATAGLVSVSGTIVSGNNGHQCNVAVADGGSNLNSPTASDCAFAATGKGNVFAAPQLGALASNGGPTTTRLPSATSPALNKITASASTGVNDAITGSPITLCTGTDQRGTSRPQGAKCDIGAVEAEQTVPVLSGPASATYAVGVAGAPQQFTSTGSPQPTLSATGLPSGVTFTDNGNGTGTLAGTPGANTGGVHSIAVKATNEAGSDTRTFTLTINQAPALAGPAGATYTVGQPGGPTTFTSTGHPTPALSSAGILPTGVGFADNGDGTGAYAGTPGSGTGGLYNTTVKAANGSGPDATAPFTLTVNEASALTGPNADTFTVGTSSQGGEYVGTGFPVPTLSAAGLPAGLTLTGTGAGKGKVAGNAANGTGGVYPVTVTATNGVGSPATRSTTVTVNEAPELVGPAEARFVTGSASSIGFSSDGFPQATLTRTGTLPAGLTFTDNGNGSATISGTAPASAVGTYPVTVRASNGQSPDATRTVVIEVVPPLSISTTVLPNAAYRTAYSAQVTGSGGQPGYTFQIVSGALPAGLSMSPQGLITGSANAATGTFTFTVKATDSATPAQTATKQLSITLVKGSTQVDVTPILFGVKPNGDVTLNVGLVEADLRGGFPLQPIAGAPVVFKSGTKTVCTGTTNAAGHAQCSQNVLDALLTPLKGTLTATYAGNATWNGSSGSAPLIKK